MNLFLNSVLVTLALATGGLVSFADDTIRDSSSAAVNGFAAEVQAARSVLVRVPVNAQNEENTSKATLRVYEGETRAVNSLSDIEAIWVDSKDQSHVPQVTEGEPRDSSTWGWSCYSYRWGWASGLNYYSPVGYYFGTSYAVPTYYSPVYYTGYYGAVNYRYYYWNF